MISAGILHCFATAELVEINNTLQIWQKFRVSTGLPTSSHMTEQIRGDNSLSVSRKNSRGNRDAGIAAKPMMERKKGFCRIFEPFGC